MERGRNPKARERDASGAARDPYGRTRPDEKLPLLCQELYYKYCVDFRDETFDRFYRSTLHIFRSFAIEKCAAAGGNLDPQEIVNRLYGTLVAHASGHRRIPIRALLSWCFGTICNMIKEELRTRSKGSTPLKGLEIKVDSPSTLDLIIRREETKRFKALYEKIMQLIASPNRILSKKEREVMRLFYCEGMALRGIASVLRIRAEYVAVILFRARRRIALLMDPSPKGKEE